MNYGIDICHLDAVQPARHSRYNGSAAAAFKRQDDQHHEQHDREPVQEHEPGFDALGCQDMASISARVLRSMVRSSRGAVGATSAA